MSELSQNLDSYLLPKLESRQDPESGEHAVFAVQAIKKGEVLAMWGGKVVTAEFLETLPEKTQRLGVQVEENLYIVNAKVGPGDYINHCCDPNAGMYGQIGLVTMRDIAPGEEVCYDYAMSDGSSYDEFECHCGSQLCRQHITGEDWRNPVLWDRYAGYFSPYLQRRIDILREQGASQ